MRNSDINGFELSEKSHLQTVESTILDTIPELNGKLPSGLIGYGSDVIGNYDEFSKGFEWRARRICCL